MKIGNVEIKIGANEVVLGSVVILTILLLWVSPDKDSIELFKQGFGALIAWGAGYAAGHVKKGAGE